MVSSFPSIGPNLFGGIVESVDPFAAATKASKSLLHLLTGVQAGAPEMLSSSSSDEDSKVFSTPGMAAEARLLLQNKKKQSTLGREQDSSESQNTVARSTKFIRGGLQRYVQSLYENAWQERLETARKQFLHFKNRACGSATTATPPRMMDTTMCLLKTTLQI